MRGALRHLLVALALLFAQHAAQVHAMSHLGHDGKGAPPAGHPAEQCLAFHALDGSLPGLAQAGVPGGCTAVPTAFFKLPLQHPPRIVFDSRAPPVLS